MEIRWVQTRQEIGKVLEQLDQLSESCPWVQPFFSPTWIETWLETSQRAKSAVLLVAEDQGVVCGFWPFFEYRAFWWKGLWPLCAEFADFFDPLYEGRPETLRALARGLEQALDQGYAFAWIPCLSERWFAESDLWSTEVQVQVQKRLIRKRAGNPILTIEGDYSTWETAHTSARSRKNMRRQERQLRERGEVVFAAWEHPGDLRDVLRICATIEQQSWKAEEGKGLWTQASCRRFYRTLLPRLAEEGRLIVHTMTVDGIYIAYQIGLREGAWYGLHSLGFLAEYAEQSPGKLLLLHFIEESFESKKYRTVDFLQGAFDYKLRFASETQNLYDVTLFSQRLSGRLTRWLMKRGDQRAKRTKKPLNQSLC